MNEVASALVERMDASLTTVPSSFVNSDWSGGRMEEMSKFGGID